MVLSSWRCAPQTRQHFTNKYKDCFGISNTSQTIFFAPRNKYSEGTREKTFSEFSEMQLQDYWSEMKQKNYTEVPGISFLIFTLHLKWKWGTCKSRLLVIQETPRNKTCWSAICNYGFYTSTLEIEISSARRGQQNWILKFRDQI